MPFPILRSRLRPRPGDSPRPRVGTRVLPRVRSAAGLLAGALLVLGCGPADQGDTDRPAQEPPAARADADAAGDTLAALRDRIEELVADPTCDAAVECRVAGLGAKPCGGPWSYLVYSSTRTDTAELAGLVEEYNAAESALNEAEGRTSDCAVLARPELACREGQCVPLDTGPATVGETTP